MEPAICSRNRTYLNTLLTCGADVNMVSSLSPIGENRNPKTFQGIRTEFHRMNVDISTMSYRDPTLGRQKRWFEELIKDDCATVLEMALRDNQVEIDKLLLQYMVALKNQDVLFLGNTLENEELVQLLVARGANAMQSRGEPFLDNPLLAALTVYPVTQSSLNIIRTLSAHSTQSKIRQATNLALVTTCYEGNLDHIQLILDMGANVNQSSKVWWKRPGDMVRTPLMAAMGKIRKDVTLLLLSRGADVNKVVQGLICGNALSEAHLLVLMAYKI